ncbi:MAG TPA: hypothetical protein VJ180_14730 [Pyrinomonadaceae bacterium]|nr:hypothetical protein [Pyrinomonadaceae bacterium]
MERQHTENLFRRFKGQLVTIKTVSGGIYEGRVTEITNDYVSLLSKEEAESSIVFLFFIAVESMMVVELPSR